jgi:LmbE family N-acetylglucosaminyl deacetylase
MPEEPEARPDWICLIDAPDFRMLWARFLSDESLMPAATNPLRILIIGAHPDDCDLKAGGTTALWRKLGHDVRWISVTNGESGHQTMSGEELVRRRTAEAAASGNVVGIKYDVLRFRDGYLQPTIEARFEIIGLIRSYNPDLILTHRPNDYHPDHRATSTLVCDAAYMVTVPPIVPGVPALRRNPVIAYLADHFTRPYPFSPSVVVDIEPVLDTVVEMLNCHVSQFYEWLAYNNFFDKPMPENAEERKQFLAREFKARIAPMADQHRDLLIKIYGEDRGRTIRYIEAFEPCEYGSPLNESNVRQLFPFLP